MEEWVKLQLRSCKMGRSLISALWLELHLSFNAGRDDDALKVRYGRLFSVLCIVGELGKITFQYLASGSSPEPTYMKVRAINYTREEWLQV